MIQGAFVASVQRYRLSWRNASIVQRNKCGQHKLLMFGHSYLAFVLCGIRMPRFGYNRTSTR